MTMYIIIILISIVCTLCLIGWIFTIIHYRKIPVPENRFTTEEENGEVTIEVERIQELILYMDDLENWIELKK